MKKKAAFDLTQHLEAIQLRIDKGRCELTGLPLRLTHGLTWDSPSLDRVDPTQGYLYSNIRIVCHAANSALGNWGESVLMQLSKGMAAQRREASNTLSEQLGQNLMRLMEGRGSPLYKLTWKRVTTLSGRLFYRQQASVRRTSGSGSIGWPKTAAWPTPTVRDHKDGASEGTAPINALLGRQVWTVRGPTAIGSCATIQTVKDGAQLNPDLSRWLQGYPKEWGFCGAMAMQSCRKSRQRSSKPQE
jgi:hypothetical protein